MRNDGYSDRGADYGNFTGVKSLFRVDYMLHGTSDKIEGPYSWEPALDLPRGINPAALAFLNATTGQTVYTLWDGGVLAADSPLGPWRTYGRGCGGNPAPAYFNGTFYCTSQHTLEISSQSTVSGAWSKLSDINVTLKNGSRVPYAKALPNVEDPFLWIDKRGNFHIINHRYDTTQTVK